MEPKIMHTIDMETVEKLNEVLKGTGWTVGKLYYELTLLESDIKMIGIEAYNSDQKTSKELYETKQRLEDFATMILTDGESLKTQKKAED